MSENEEYISIMCRFTLGIGLNGGHEDEYEIEVPANFYEMQESEREAILTQAWQEYANNYIDGGCAPIQ